MDIIEHDIYDELIDLIASGESLHQASVLLGLDPFQIQMRISRDKKLRQKVQGARKTSALILKEKALEILNVAGGTVRNIESPVEQAKVAMMISDRLSASASDLDPDNYKKKPTEKVGTAKVSIQLSSKDSVSVSEDINQGAKGLSYDHD